MSSSSSTSKYTVKKDLNIIRRIKKLVQAVEQFNKRTDDSLVPIEDNPYYNLVSLRKELNNLVITTVREMPEDSAEETEFQRQFFCYFDSSINMQIRRILWSIKKLDQVIKHRDERVCRSGSSLSDTEDDPESDIVSLQKELYNLIVSNDLCKS